MKNHFIRVFAPVMIVMIGMLSIPVYAADVGAPEFDIQSAYYNNAITSISISGSGTASCSATVTGKRGVTTKITIKLYLQKYSNGKWTTVKQWSGSKNGTSYTLSKTTSISKGKYRTKAICKIYSGREYETITKYSGAKTY